MPLVDICRAAPWGTLRSTGGEWLPLPAPLPADRDEIHVWRAWLPVDRSRLESLAGVLDRSEREKAGMYHSSRDGDRYVAAHGMLRELLASYLGVAPESIAYRCSERGKPDLAHSLSGRSLGFNMTHSLDVALFAVGESIDLGVDVECVSGALDIEELGRACLSACEREALDSLPGRDRREALFQWWTRKEAVAKAAGEGLAASFKRLSVIPPYLEHPGLDPGGEPAVERDEWSVWDLTPWPGYVGALASRGERRMLRLFEFRAPAAHTGRRVA